MRKIGFVLLCALLAAGVLCGACFGVWVRPSEATEELPRRIVDLRADEIGRIELVGHSGTVVCTGREEIRRVVEALCKVPLDEPERYDGAPVLDSGDCMTVRLYQRDGALYRGWSFRHDWRLRFDAPEGGGCYYNLKKPEVDMGQCHRTSEELARNPDFFR